MTISETLTYFTIGSVSVVSLIGFVAKSIFNNYLNKRVELFKNELSRENDVFKLHLQKESYEHQVKFSKLHVERAEVIKMLYQQLVELKRLMTTAVDNSKLKKFSLDDTKRIWELHKATELNFTNYRIFFSEESCGKIKEFLSSVMMTTILFDIHELKSPEYNIANKNFNPDKEALDKSDFLEIMNKSGVFEDLENEFRKLIGAQ